MSSQNTFVQGPWEGDTKIVLGIDIGSTQSGVTYSFLEKGTQPTIHRVNRWPGQEGGNVQSKIPTCVWYDLDGQAVSFGAEAFTHQAKEDAEDHGWRFAKHFKLHRHPQEIKGKRDFKVDPLPEGVPLEKVYTDFFKYILNVTRSFFEDRMVDGPRIWEKYQSQMEVVIAHPNGWGIFEQSFLREVAIDAGLADVNSPQNIRFVTEGEASAHFCIYHTNLGNQLKVGNKFIVCDAGGSTVDTTVYLVVSTEPVLIIKEARASGCVQAGGIFVDGAAKKYLRRALGKAALDPEIIEEYAERGIEDFESSAKRNFVGGDEIVKIADGRFNDSSIKVRRGRMTMPAELIKSFFDVCLTDIVSSVDQQMRGADVSYMLLAGGFGDSPFLRQELKTRYAEHGCKVYLSNDPTTKAVADGSVIWSIAGRVVGRAPRSAIGTDVLKNYDPSSPEFRGRKSFMRASGEAVVDGGWSRIVRKGIALDAEAIARRSFNRRYSSRNPELERLVIKLYSYSGDSSPEWLQDEQGGLLTEFKEVCTLEADMGRLSGALQCHVGIHGKDYWKLSYDICIQFGGTEWLAYLEWVENGITRTGEVVIIPSERV